MSAAAGQALRLATSRSRDAELATDQAMDACTSDAHLTAATLHLEAATWSKRAGRPARAERHQEQAQVHAQLASQLSTDQTTVDNSEQAEAPAHGH